jgi:hypothetical protein
VASPLSVLSVSVLVLALSPQRKPPPPDPVSLVSKAVLEMEAARRSQKRLLPPYRVIKRYTVRTSKLKTPAILEVLWTYNPKTGKRFEVRSNQNALGFTLWALMEVLKNEEQNSRLEQEPGSITPDHYAFQLVSREQNRLKLRITPRTTSKYLLNGYAFLPANGGAVTRVEGTTSSRLSFWVSEATIEQDFGNFRNFWLPTKTRSSARVRFVGPTNLIIEAGEYRFANGTP